jgi:hypothetical protein
MKHGEIRIKNETLTALNPYLIQRGVPLPPGVVQDENGVSVADADGNTLASAGRVLQRRPDDSVEWMHLDIQVDLGPQEEKSIFVVPEPAAQPEITNPVTVREDGPLVHIANGLSEVVVSRAGGSLIDCLVINGRTIVDESMLVDLQLVDEGGKIHRASQSGSYDVTITHPNPLRTEVKVAGKHAARDGSTFMDFALRATLIADNPDIKLEHTFYCREDREGLMSIESMRLIMPTTMDGGAKKLIRQTCHGQSGQCRSVEIAENIEIVASSVGNINNYAQEFQGPVSTHPDAGGSIFLRNMDSLHEDWSDYPFHMRPGGASGFRADLSTGGMRGVWPVAGWQDDEFTLVTTFEHFRQLHPKSIAIDENVVTWSIWPEWSTPMSVVQGVSKSHIIWLTGQAEAMTVDQVIDVLGRWEYGYSEPVDISFDPAWPAYCEALDCHQLLKFQPEKYPLLENLLESKSGASNPGRECYDRQSAIGMFHFADIVNPAATFCYNNEDDTTVMGPLQQFLRTGQTYLWDYGKEAARHYMEVDFCEWSTDPRQHGGLIPHCGQHFVGNVYPSHQWVEGILAYYYMSGDERARNVVVSVGDNYVYWANNAVESCTLDGREAGVPLVNLAAVYRLTRDEKYIDAARLIIDAFFVKLDKLYGEFKYPYPQSANRHPQKLITGYADWSCFEGLYRLWEQTADTAFHDRGVRLLKQFMKPETFTLNDARGMDFFGAWALGMMTGDMDDAIARVANVIPMLLRRGGHPLRRLHFLKELDERGLIDERDVGTRDEGRWPTVDDASIWTG